MILLIHIFIALASIFVASATFFNPSVRRIGMSYAFIVATLVSGTALIFVAGADVLRTCLTGLLYVTVVSLVTIATHIRIRRFEHVKTDD